MVFIRFRICMGTVWTLVGAFATDTSSIVEVRVLVAVIGAAGMADVVLPDDVLVVNVDVAVVLQAVRVMQFVTFIKMSV